MKKLTTLIAACTLGLAAAAQEGFVPLEKWDYTAFCSYTDLHPIQVVRADNNWQILWALRTGGTSRDLAVQGIPCTRSQLMLLATQRLLTRTEQGALKTAVPILDSLATTQLRRVAAASAEAMYDELAADLKSFADALEREGFGDNAYSVLFSHVLDGTIWEEFERRKVVVDVGDDTGVWSGTVWFSYPRSEAFRPGTNTLSLGGRYALHVNWAESDPAFAGRIYADDAQRFFRQSLTGEEIDSAAMAAGCELGLWDGERATVPLIRRRGALAQRVKRLTRALCDAFLRHTDLREVRDRTGCRSDSDAALICYHEVMWQLSDRLLASGVVRLPHLFADPAHAVPGDMSAVSFITAE